MNTMKQFYMVREITKQCQNQIQYFVTKFGFIVKWFEPRSISSSYSVIVRVKVVLKRTVVGDYLTLNPKSPTTVLFRTTFTRIITLFELKFGFDVKFQEYFSHLTSSTETKVVDL